MDGTDLLAKVAGWNIVWSGKKQSQGLSNDHPEEETGINQLENCALYQLWQCFCLPQSHIPPRTSYDNKKDVVNT